MSCTLQQFLHFRRFYTHNTVQRPAHFETVYFPCNGDSYIFVEYTLKIVYIHKINLTLKLSLSTVYFETMWRLDNLQGVYWRPAIIWCCQFVLGQIAGRKLAVTWYIQPTVRRRSKDIRRRKGPPSIKRRPLIAARCHEKTAIRDLRIGLFVDQYAVAGVYKQF